MEQLVGALMSIALFFAIVYAIARAVAKTLLEPIHAKLDRILALQERSLVTGSADNAHQ